MRLQPGQVPEPGLRRGAHPAGRGRSRAGDVRLQAGGELRGRLRADAHPPGADVGRPLLPGSPEGAQQRAALQDPQPGPGVQEADHQSQQEGEDAAGATVLRAQRAADDCAEVSEEVHRVQREDRLPHRDRGFLLQGNFPLSGNFPPLESAVHSNSLLNETCRFTTKYMKPQGKQLNTHLHL